MWSKKRWSHQSRLLDARTVHQKINLLNSIANGQKKKSHPRALKPRLVLVEERFGRTRKLREHYLTTAFLRSVWPKYQQPPTTLADMNEEETAIWVEMLGSFKGWKEAKAYAHCFKTNGVTGSVLPYLSVKTLRSELNILKFGHRLEIITAIENNELTIINPFIISNCSDASFEPNKNFNESHSQRAKKWASTKLSENEVQKWFSKIPRKTSMPVNTRKNGSSYYCECASSKANFTYDTDPHKVGGGDIWMPKNEWILHSDINSRCNRRVKETISKSKHQWIPSNELPPGMPGSDGEQLLNDMTKELVQGGKERLSTLFSNAKSETTSSCECTAQNNFWGNLAVWELVSESPTTSL